MIIVSVIGFAVVSYTDEEHLGRVYVSAIQCGRIISMNWYCRSLIILSSTTSPVITSWWLVKSYLSCYFAVFTSNFCGFSFTPRKMFAHAPLTLDEPPLCSFDNI